VKNIIQKYLLAVVGILIVSACSAQEKRTLSETTDEDASTTLAQAQPDAPKQAIDLWNGFTSDMTLEQVAEKADALLEAKGNQSTETSLKIGYDDKLNGSFPKNLIVYVYDSPLSQYYQYRYHVYLATANVKFYFRQDKLFAIKVLWAARGTSLVEKTNEQYGKYEDYTDSKRAAYVSNLAGVRQNIPESRVRIYSWKAPGKLVYVEYETSGNNDTGILTVVDGGEYYNAFLEAQQQKSEEYQREKDRQAEATNKIQF
jgi:hypothetical protein